MKNTWLALALVGLAASTCGAHPFRGLNPILRPTTAGRATSEFNSVAGRTASSSASSASSSSASGGYKAHNALPAAPFNSASLQPTLTRVERAAYTALPSSVVSATRSAASKAAPVSSRAAAPAAAASSNSSLKAAALPKAKRPSARQETFNAAGVQQRQVFNKAAAPVYPKNGGAKDEWVDATLLPGVYKRRGNLGPTPGSSALPPRNEMDGVYFTDYNSKIPQLSLINTGQSQKDRVFMITRPLTVQTSTVAPAGGMPGGARQYRLKPATGTPNAPTLNKQSLLNVKESYRDVRLSDKHALTAKFQNKTGK